MTRPFARRARSLGALGAAVALAALAACSKDADLRLTTPPAGASFMARYVSIGNSITAGYQSSGINDSTQAQSYAVLLAKAAGVPFNVPYLNKPGCTAPIANLATGARVGGASATACYGRTATSINATINNVAVPGANSFDPTGLPGAGSSVLTSLILGGRTQVERALEIDPTFATVWIGNNDVLGFALAGDTVTRTGTTITGRVTDSLTFINNYNSMIGQLRSRRADIKGVLIGVVDVTNTPLLVPISLINPASAAQSPAPAYPFNPVAYGTVQAVIGRPIAFNANCSNTNASIAFNAFASIAAATASLPPGTPVPFSCAGAAETQGVLDDTERAFFIARVAGWNNYIKAKADSIGFAYYDPNVRLGALKTSGAVVPFPNLASATPFGTYISNDGVHPALATHVILAGDLATLINTKYGSSLPTTITP